MTITKLATMALAALTLAACASVGLPAPKDPAQAVYELDTGYAAALAVAVQYVQLPKCGSADASVVCSDPAVVAKLRAADAVAAPALAAADAAVQAPGFGTDAVATVVAAATAAVQAFIAITATLGVK